MSPRNVLKTICKLFVAAALGLAPRLGQAQMPDTSKVTLKTTPVGTGLTMIEGVNGFAGGNVLASVGDDGLFIVDDALQPMNAKLKAALAGLSKKPVRFVVNTHWHPDHTGGNLTMGSGGAVIVAQDNVLKRLGVEQVRNFMGRQMVTPATPPAGLPVVTFTDDVTLHLNGDEVHVVHVAPAHTDGDAIVHFKKTNAIHTGDVVGAGYPIVDVESGGTFEGFIAAADKILALADDATKIVPGHGPIMTKADVAAWRQMLVDVRDRVAKLDGAKKTLDEIKAAKPLADLDARWGQGMVKADFLVEMVVKTKPPAAPAPDKSKGKKPKK
jgi:glyoxylase-like metal-dependent hydrolase (beta-lactamase superfamily II)